MPLPPLLGVLWNSCRQWPAELWVVAFYHFVFNNLRNLEFRKIYKLFQTNIKEVTPPRNQSRFSNRCFCISEHGSLFSGDIPEKGFFLRQSMKSSKILTCKLAAGKSRKFAWPFVHSFSSLDAPDLIIHLPYQSCEILNSILRAGWFVFFPTLGSLLGEVRK